MKNSCFIETGKIQGDSAEHFARFATRADAILGALTITEACKGDWGKSPKVVRTKIIEHLAMLTDVSRPSMQLSQDGNLSAVEIEGYPEILEAMKNRTLRIFIGIDSNGLRKASCAIVKSTPHKDRAAPSINLVTLLAGSALSLWFWSKLPATYPIIAKVGIGIGLAILVVSVTLIESKLQGKRRR